eukprot:Awhi_evm1s5671
MNDYLSGGLPDSADEIKRKFAPPLMESFSGSRHSLEEFLGQKSNFAVWNFLQRTREQGITKLGLQVESSPSLADQNIPPPSGTLPETHDD